MELFKVSYFSKDESARKNVLVRSISLLGAIIRVFKETEDLEEDNVVDVRATRVEGAYLD